MATPITAGAIVFEARSLISGDAGVQVEVAPLLLGMLAALGAGLLAIHVTLRYLRTHSLSVFAAYRFVLAAVVVVVLHRPARVTPRDRPWRS